MPELVFLRLEVPAGELGRLRNLERQRFADRQAVAFEADELARIVGEQTPIGSLPVIARWISSGIPVVSRSLGTSNNVCMIVAIKFWFVTGVVAGAAARASDWPITCPVLVPPP